MKLRLFIISILLVLTGNIYAQQDAVSELPAVTLKAINGKTVNTAQLSNDGKPIIISFFATWCKPCNRE